ncbi:hypothetical protein [Pedobacter suwonensis]|uniref:hypothetical protein n=1 Tax=Pedobacter suwonensis TaxID=332999 RepID=UPI003829337E
MGKQQEGIHTFWTPSLRSYIGGFCFVVSGGIFVVVSGIDLDVVSIGAVVVESVVVLSEEPAMFFDELHADVAIIREPAKARLKIIFFIVFNVIYHPKQPYNHLVLNIIR